MFGVLGWTDVELCIGRTKDRPTENICHPASSVDEELRGVR
jgi:hypothetical protein